MLPVYALLAAGRATRMGFAKAFTPLEGVAPLARIAQTLDRREFVVVTASVDVNRARTLAPNAAAFAHNDEPERGMAHSLQCALTKISPDRDVGVLLADMPWITADTLGRVEALLGDAVDVAYPVDDAGVPGHPVLFAARCRFHLDALPEGDTIRIVRVEPSLRRANVLVRDPGAFVDLDRPSDWHAL